MKLGFRTKNVLLSYTKYDSKISEQGKFYINKRLQIWQWIFNLNKNKGKSNPQNKNHISMKIERKLTRFGFTTFCSLFAFNSNFLQFNLFYFGKINVIARFFFLIIFLPGRSFLDLMKLTYIFSIFIKWK